MESPLGVRDHDEVPPQRANPNPVSCRRTMFRAIASGLLFCWIAAVPAAGENCVDYTDYLHFVGSVEIPGVGSGITVNGHHAYVAESDNEGSSHLLVLDISTALPEVVGSVQTTGRALDVACDGAFAYIVSKHPFPYHSTLQVVDVSNAASPVVVGSIDTPVNVEPEEPRGVVVAGTYAYVAITNCQWVNCGTNTGRLEIIDISNPSLPAIVGSVETPFQPMDVAVAGNYAYIGTKFCDYETCMGTLDVVDVSSPASPVIVASVAMDEVYDVVVAGTHAYVTGLNLLTGGYGLHIFDISNPTTPAMVGSAIAFGGGLAVAGNLAFFVGGPGLHVVDVSNPSSPAIIGSTGLPESPTHVAVAGNYAYFTAWDSSLIGVVDLSNLTSPAIIGHADLGGARSVVVAGNLAYVASYPGLQIVNVSNPASPVIVGGVNIPNWPVSVAVAGSYAYAVITGSTGPPHPSSLQVVDILEPTAPIIVGSVEIPRLARDVAVAGNFAYVVENDGLHQSGLQIVDVSNATAPTIVGSAALAGWAGRVAVAGNNAFVVRRDDIPFSQGGLDVIDVSNPASPVIRSSVVIIEAWDVAVAGNLACVAMLGLGPGGLEVLDVSNPAAPAIMGSIHAYWPNSVTTDGNYAYTTNPFGVRIIDISTPASPAFVGGANIPRHSSVNDVVVQNGLACIAESYDGLYILPAQCQAPTSVEPPLSPAGMPRYLLSQNHPNPFVAEVGATAIGFTLREQVHTKLRVFDATGRLVRVLVDEELGAGPHTVQWDGRNEAGGETGSGIYYYRLQAGAFSEGRAMVRLK